MSKPNLPPVTITLDREYKLRFTMKSIFDLSQELGRNVIGSKGLFDDEDNIDLKAVAAALAHGLQEDKKGITTEQVMELVDVRQLGELAGKIAEAFGAKPEDSENPTAPTAS